MSHGYSGLSTAKIEGTYNFYGWQFINQRRRAPASDTLPDRRPASSPNPTLPDVQDSPSQSQMSSQNLAKMSFDPRQFPPSDVGPAFPYPSWESSALERLFTSERLAVPYPTSENQAPFQFRPSRNSHSSLSRLSSVSFKTRSPAGSSQPQYPERQPPQEATPRYPNGRLRESSITEFASVSLLPPLGIGMGEKLHNPQSSSPGHPHFNVPQQPTLGTPAYFSSSFPNTTLGQYETSSPSPSPYIRRSSTVYYNLQASGSYPDPVPHNQNRQWQ